MRLFWPALPAVSPINPMVNAAALAAVQQTPLPPVMTGPGGEAAAPSIEYGDSGGPLVADDEVAVGGWFGGPRAFMEVPRLPSVAELLADITRDAAAPRLLPAPLLRLLHLPAEIAGTADLADYVQPLTGPVRHEVISGQAPHLAADLVGLSRDPRETVRADAPAITNLQGTDFWPRAVKLPTQLAAEARPTRGTSLKIMLPTESSEIAVSTPMARRLDAQLAATVIRNNPVLQRALLVQSLLQAEEEAAASATNEMQVRDVATLLSWISAAPEMVDLIEVQIKTHGRIPDAALRAFVGADQSAAAKMQAAATYAQKRGNTLSRGEVGRLAFVKDSVLSLPTTTAPQLRNLSFVRSTFIMESEPLSVEHAAALNDFLAEVMVMPRSVFVALVGELVDALTTNLAAAQGAQGLRLRRDGGTDGVGEDDLAAIRVAAASNPADAGADGNGADASDQGQS